MALSAIGAQKAAATEDTAAAIEKLLDYVATYPNDVILLIKSDIILAAHADSGYLNESIARIRVGAHKSLAENEPKPKLNSPVLTIAQIIKTVMAPAAEAEMAALFITEKYDTTAPYTHRNGLATTSDTNPNRQLNSGGIH